MVDKDLALVNPFGLPYSFMEELKARSIHLVEIDPADNPWINNSLAIAPRTAPDAGGRHHRTLDALPSTARLGPPFPTTRCTRTEAASTARQHPCGGTGFELSG
jgi:hypothetical protein